MGLFVDDLLKKLGGRPVSVYYTSEVWDGLVIFEAPDENKALAAIVCVMSRPPGGYQDDRTIRHGGCEHRTAKDGR